MRRDISDEASEDGKNYSLHFQNCHFFTRRSALLNSFSKTCSKRTRETHRAEKVKSGGSDPTVLQNRGPIPLGFGGHSRLLLLESAARVLAAEERGIRNFVRRPVRQNRKGGTKKKHGNHQGTTQTTQVSDDPGPGRGVGENAARSIREIHRLHSVLRHYGGSESPV